MSSPVSRAPLSDAALRREVLGPAQSWMLQAPAGSGKTELLMQRFLACLATVEQPESVLAITFTRKAAAEMRNRILLALQGARDLSDEQIAERPPHVLQSLQLARAVLNTSAALGWNILAHPARLQVRTLDSFCEAVAQRAPFKGLLGGVAQITEDAGPLYDLAAQRVIDELAAPGSLGDAVAALLGYLDNDVRRARDLLASMLAQRDQWLHFLGRSDAFDAQQQQSLRSRLEAALALSVAEELQLIRTHVAAALSSSQHAELFALMRYRAEHGAQDNAASSPVIASIAASAVLLAFPPSAAHPLRDIAQWPAAEADALPAWRAIAGFLLTAERSKPALRKSVDKRSGFPSDTPEGKRQRKRCMDALEAVAKLPNAAELCGELHRIRRLPDPRYTEAQWAFMLALLEVLPRAAAHLQLVFSEQAVIDFAEYAQRALDAIGQEGDPTELGLQLGYRIRHILVDEFQDTNRVQVELLARLLATWEPDEPCSTFCVGDPMQSIYAFRQADVAIYQQARSEGIGNRPHQFDCLRQNFRSQANLVEWFNQIFPQILREQSDLTNAVAYAPAETTRPALDGAAVEIKGFAPSNRAAEAQHLAECIQRELARIPPPADGKPSIAVLVRSRTHLPELVEALRAAGVAYRAVKTDRLAERPLVRDLEALRAALTDLADRTAWLAVLRAPWCGLSLADLLELCRNDDRSDAEHSTVRALLRQRQQRLSTHGRTALARCLPVLDDALTQRGRGGLRSLVESTWLRLGGPACVADSAQAVRDSEAYFALLDAQSPSGALRDPQNFAVKLRELFAPADQHSGIRVEIMPIHQAKGLEWDVVFLPALERRPRQDDKRLLYWRLRRRGAQESLLLGPMDAPGKASAENTGPGKADRNAPAIESYLRNIASDCSREELKRLFYVAATRARQRFYLSAAVDPTRQPNADSILRLLWPLPGMQQAFAPNDLAENASPESAPPAEAVSAPQRLLRRLPASIVEPPTPVMPPPLPWYAPQSGSSGEQHRFEWVGELLPRVGVVAHSFLQRIALDGLPLWDAAHLAAARPAIASALLRAGVLPSELEQGIARVNEALRRTLEDERGRWLLSPHPEHCCELAVSAVFNGELHHVRIDRTFLDDGTRWLIDYKITEQQGGDPRRFVEMQVEKYHPDIERYARVLRAYDPRPLRCALYLPLLGRFCEVDVNL
ncbi:MAG: UvrD-helicase domain-containing protein [Candidatus Korobacteraceae bacterium]